MKDKDIKNWTKPLKAVELTADEKRAGRLALLTAMETKPGFFSRFNRRMRVLSGAMAMLVLFSGGGVSYAAQSALPGELLYPVKTDINEEVKTFFIKDAKKKVEWEIERVEMRMKELEIVPEFKDHVEAELMENREALKFFYEEDDSLHDLIEDGIEEWFEEEADDEFWDFIEEEAEEIFDEIEDAVHDEIHEILEEEDLSDEEIFEEIEAMMFDEEEFIYDEFEEDFEEYDEEDWEEEEWMDDDEWEDVDESL